MKKTQLIPYLICVSFFSFHFVGFAQHTCMVSHVNSSDIEDNNSNNQSLLNGSVSNDIFNVNVVFHVVYNTAAENLHDSIILNQMNVLTEDFRRMNADTVNMRPEFESIVADPRINLQLATVDPDGNATNGITRTQTSKTYFNFDDYSESEKVKFTADGGKDPWDTDKYLNIWICNGSIDPNPIVYGYSSPNVAVLGWSATDLTERDGVVLTYQIVGANNPNPLSNSLGQPKNVLGHLATHEVGHYFGLMHIFQQGCLQEGDYITDTPKSNDATNFGYCDTTLNNCVDNIGTLGDLPDMIENFMGYADETCQNSFTQGQVDFMRGFIEMHRPDLVGSTPVSINEWSSDVNVVFEPETNVVKVLSESVDIANIGVYDFLGRQINQIKAQDKSVLINNLKDGMYVLEIRLENNERISKKVIL